MLQGRSLVFGCRLMRSVDSLITTALIMYLKLNVDEGIKTKVDLTLVQTGKMEHIGLHIAILFCYTFKLYWY